MLPSCPVLEELFLQQRSFLANPPSYKIIVPSLRRLSLIFEGYRSKGDVNLVIDTPSLKSLQILLHSLASVVHIRLCLSASETRTFGGMYMQIGAAITIYACDARFTCLKVITINQCHPVINPRTRHWNQPGSVPRCFSSNLEIFEWIKYEGKQYEKKLSTYILKTAVLLKKASFTARSDDYKEKLLMIQELSFSQRASSTSISYSVKIIEEDMDRISLLPNDFLLHILSLLPTKDVPATSLLSKRWLNLWKLVSKLNYIERDDNADHVGFVRFVDRSLLLNTALVLESLHFNLDQQCNDVDVGFWIITAVKRGLRELSFEYCYTIEEPIRLPQSLYTCGTLVVLKLQNVSLVDVQFPVCFKLLKTLHLDEVIYLDNVTPKKLLSCCPILQVLDLDRAENDNVRRFSITVPSLQRFDYYGRPGSVLVMFPSGSIFHQLEHLEFCTCETEWDLLMSLLQHSPKLRSLKLNEIHNNVCGYRTLHWEEPSTVPETLMLVLETFEWRNYRGRNVERELASFVLKHARRLKVATFSPLASTQLDTTLGEKYRMITDLARLPRGSTECELVFG
ncbi:BnaC03g13550D [Brassica napus]|uniref:(rape) hypothetical protein n=1 Tax=Brassica napus TaxID=3708 RepID=A0A078FG35_BRANA|nr:unnamed protein product [Brassica napus]CDY11929.1 BnaC03g13550D [Brassica napus]